MLAVLFVHLCILHLDSVYLSRCDFRLLLVKALCLPKVAAAAAVSAAAVRSASFALSCRKNSWFDFIILVSWGFTCGVAGVTIGLFL